jgi:putative transposase
MERRKKVYSTYKIRVKKDHKLFEYLINLCKNSKNLYNATQFHVRQIYTGLTSDKKLHLLQKEVLDNIEHVLPKMNQVKENTYNKKIAKGEKATLTLFKLPTKKKPNINFGFLDAYFKCTDNPDYRALPAQVNQQIMKLIFQDWKSYFEGLKDYKKHPEKYTGKPKIPGYKKSETSVCLLTNQVCKIKDERYLVFPGTKKRLNIGKIGVKGVLQQVRILPFNNEYVIEVVVKETPLENAILRDEKTNQNTLMREAIRIMSIDFGVDILAAITDNTGLPPILIKGGTLKSINQWYNKQQSFIYAALRNGKQKNEGSYTSKRIEKITNTRNKKVDDFLHKTSFNIVKLAQERNIDTIIIGKNTGWKRKSNMGKKNNQHFIQIPHARLIAMIKYKAERVGIQVVVQEESYTSKACFISNDFIPVYGVNDQDVSFSGYRKECSWYKIKGKNIIWHADLNGSANILRKRFPNAFIHSDRMNLLQPPVVIRVA